MSGGIKSAIESVISKVEAAEKAGDKTGSKLLDKLGDKVLGPTAESENNDAPVIAPDATTTPVTQGRRSRRPDGQDPFRNVPASEP